MSHMEIITSWITCLNVKRKIEKKMETVKVVEPVLFLIIIE